MSSEEWHTFLIGLFEVLCPWPARLKINKSVNSYIQHEYHYYLAGRWIGLRLLALEIAAAIYLLIHLL